MKKKIVMAIAVLGMAFGSVQVNAQNERSSPPRWEDSTGGYATFRQLPDGMASCIRCNPFGSCITAVCAG